MAKPDPKHMIEYCRRMIPGMLIDVCEVEEGLAHRIGEDVLARAEALAALSAKEQGVLIAPFLEEVFDHEPLDAPLDLRAKVTVVVRNSLLEEAHHNGPLNSGIVAITKLATGPLSHFLAARRLEPVDYAGPNAFRGLDVQYPRAWACLAAIVEVFDTGGRQPFKRHVATVPELPSTDERVEAESASSNPSATVFSAIDPRFDQNLYAALQHVAQGDDLLYTSALSRYSRNSAKLHRVLEFLLAHGATILTTNYLLRPGDVWVRRGDLVKPKSDDPCAGISDPRGLSGAHRNIASEVCALGKATPA
jgi:hypothetical protein